MLIHKKQTYCEELFLTAIPQNKTAIGAGGAIGEAISRKLYKDNYQVLGIDLHFPVFAGHDRTWLRPDHLYIFGYR